MKRGGLKVSHRKIKRPRAPRGTIIKSASTERVDPSKKKRQP